MSQAAAGAERSSPVRRTGTRRVRTPREFDFPDETRPRIALAEGDGGRRDNGGFKGLDSGLSKACPSTDGLSQKTYRSFRRRVELFERQCHRRNVDTAVEGTLLLISRLQDLAWDSTEQISFEALERSTQPFTFVYEILDNLYQYEKQVEVPSRCEEFFAEFQRLKNEDMTTYLVRHRTLLKRMRDVGVEVPALLSGWHLLTRSGIPRWTHVQVKALCQGELEYEKVHKALMKMFGGDHKPNPKDLQRTSNSTEVFFEDDYDVEDEEGYYGEDDFNDWWEEEVNFEEWQDDEPWPEELDEAVDATEEAYISYLDSRRRMRELALSRGFYPVVAIGPETDGRGQGSKGKGSSKGQSKGKGKGKSAKGKGKGKSSGFRRTFDNRRPMSGLRRPTTSSSSNSSTNTNDLRSTLSGSTGSHGPRFKRFRVQSSGVKEVPEEQVSMVEESGSVEECYFSALQPGRAIVDSGATRTIVGEKVWKDWLDHARGLPVQVTQIARDFKFGGGETLRSNYDITFPARVCGQDLEVTASVVPGQTPFLLARPTLEDWKVQQDYEKGSLKIKDSEWFKPERGKKGHYIVNLLEFENETLGVEEVLAIPEDVTTAWPVEDDVWYIEPSMDKEVTGDLQFVELEIEEESMIEEAMKAVEQDRMMTFFEVYVDEGQLSKTLLSKHEDVCVANFSLPEWDFTKSHVRKEFLQLMKLERPRHVWMAPPCTKWSSMQNLNATTEEEKQKLEEVRKDEEKTHLSFVSQVFEVGEEIDSGVSFEHPRWAKSWETKTMKDLEKKNIQDAECDRCRTGLILRDQRGQVLGKVKKPTRIRTNSPSVHEALHLKCQCKAGEHVKMEGRSKELKQMQNYESGFTEKAADAIYQDMVRRWRNEETLKIFMMDEMDEMEIEESKNEEKVVSQSDKEMMKTHGKKALQIVNKLHKQLGHPGNDKLVKALKDAKFPEEVIACARKYKCDICQSDSLKKNANPAALTEATFFNEIIEMDTFHMKWNDEKVRILAVIDLFTKYEVNALLSRETEEEELKVLEDLWFQPFGFPIRLKTDASGAHMSQKFLDAMDYYKIKLVLIPKEAHFKMGTVERLHAVRRLQLLKMKKEVPNVDLSQAIRTACNQRNRLRNIHGSSPADLVFGRAPNALSGLLDEPHDLRPDLPQAAQELVVLRTLAAKAFHEANNDALLRRSLLARPRSEHVSLELGSWAYYWRQGDTKLDTSRWRGPALVCMIEPKPKSDAQKFTPHVYWLAHGSSMVRVAPEHVRPELPRERVARLENMPETASDRSVKDQILTALRPLRGPVRFLDLQSQQFPSSGGTSFANAASPGAVSTASENTATDAPASENTATDVGISAPSALPSIAENEEEEKTDAEMTEDRKRSRTVETSEEVKDAVRVNPETTTRSRSPPFRDEKAIAFQSYNMSRQLDGMPKVEMNDPSFEKHWERVVQPMEEDEDLMAESFNEAKLTDKEKKEFSDAKDKALRVWLENKAWKAVPESEAKEGEVIPARFLQRWKPTKEGKVANARVIIQGFRHKDVLNEELDRESPTLSRTGRMLILQWACQLGWKIFAADVKSAFMQSKSIDEDTRIYIRPTAEMRRRLERLMDLKSWELLKATKPAFGDVRAPRQWYESARDFLINEAQFVQHPLDNCVFLSVRQACGTDAEFQVFEHQSIHYVVDGILGLHVDDFLGCGEEVHSVEDATGIREETDTEVAGGCFKTRLQQLAHKFRFGSWDFGRNSQILFCGTALEQSIGCDSVTLSLKDYVLKVKPITLDKSRKTMSDAPLEPKEVKMLRALIGALAWPAGQCLPQLSASISLLQASSSNPTVNDIVQANKLLRFAKDVVQGYSMTLRRHGRDLSEMRFGVYMDASWGIRPDGSSQGGHTIFIGTEEEINGGQPFPLTIVSWHSRKLNRMCRSSLSAEAQAAASAIDEVEWMKVFAAGLVCPYISIADEEVLRVFGATPALTDAKSLFDSARSVSAGLRLAEKRTAIEVAIVKERLSAMLGYMKWVNSSQQVADGLTKPGAKDNFAHVLKRGVHALKFDPSFTAAKKVTKDAKAGEEQAHEEAAKMLFQGDIFEACEVEAGICQLPGCGKALKDQQSEHRYCSRRHFYKHVSQHTKGSDAWKKAAQIAVLTLATQGVEQAGVEAASIEQQAGIDYVLLLTLLVIFLFSFIGMQTVAYKVYKWTMSKLSTLFPDKVTSNEHLFEGDEVVENDSIPSHGAAEENEIAQNDQVSDAGSSSVNDDPDVTPDEWRRWYQIKESVENERSQREWKRTLQDVVKNYSNHMIDGNLRGEIIREDWTDSRCKAYKQLLDIEDTTHCTPDQIRLWNRLCNSRLLFMVEVGAKVKEQKEKILQLERTLVQRDRNERLEGLARFRQRVSDWEVKDKVCQTPCTFDPDRNRFVSLPPRSHGSYEFQSDFYER